MICSQFRSLELSCVISYRFPCHGRNLSLSTRCPSPAFHTCFGESSARAKGGSLPSCALFLGSRFSPACTTLCSPFDAFFFFFYIKEKMKSSLDAQPGVTSDNATAVPTHLSPSARRNKPSGTGPCPAPCSRPHHPSRPRPPSCPMLEEPGCCRLFVLLLLLAPSRSVFSLGFLPLYPAAGPFLYRIGGAPL